jgi:mannose-6-phosphate isomerase-like protein (cupin superfamily)
MIPMTGLTISVLLALFVSQAEAAVTFKYISADDAARMVATTKTGQKPDNIADSPVFNLSLRMRNKPGKVETHSQWNDEIIIQEGEVQLRYGGVSVNAKESAPGETLGDSMTGGQSILMHPGDIVTIPAGMPHQMLIQTPVMRYILFKTKN